MVIQTATVEVTVEAPQHDDLAMAGFLSELGHQCKPPAYGSVLLAWEWSDDPEETVPTAYATFLVVLQTDHADNGGVIAAAYQSFVGEKDDLPHATGCRVVCKSTGYQVD